MTERVNLIVGFDQREAIAYHVFCQSVIEKASLPVQFLQSPARLTPASFHLSWVVSSLLL